MITNVRACQNIVHVIGNSKILMFIFGIILQGFLALIYVTGKLCNQAFCEMPKDSRHFAKAPDSLRHFTKCLKFPGISCNAWFLFLVCLYRYLRDLYWKWGGYIRGHVIYFSGL